MEGVRALPTLISLSRSRCSGAITATIQDVQQSLRRIELNRSLFELVATIPDMCEPANFTQSDKILRLRSMGDHLVSECGFRLLTVAAMSVFKYRRYSR